MRRSALLLVLFPVLLAGCYPTSIVTVSPYSGNYGSYMTTVRVPQTHTVTATTQIYATNNDISLSLDLQAVGAAFAQSSTVKEFESLLNNSNYMISNLDLNSDGYVDYLRVVETFNGREHLFLIQAELGADVYQDVATIVVDNPGRSDYRIEIVGAPFIYGPSYYVRPVYYTRPLILTCLSVINYVPWVSPWYWGHYPGYYRHPAPIHPQHYHAYVDTYMRNHCYCHHAEYPHDCFYPEYDRDSRGMQRNDYGSKHPEQSFSARNTGGAAAPRTGTGNTVNNGNTGYSRVGQQTAPRNANDIRKQQEEATVSRTITTGSGSVASGSNGQNRSSSRTYRTSSTVTTSRVNNSGTANTTTHTTSSGSSSSTQNRNATRGSNGNTQQHNSAAQNNTSNTQQHSSGKSSGGSIRK